MEKGALAGDLAMSDEAAFRRSRPGGGGAGPPFAGEPPSGGGGGRKPPIEGTSNPPHDPAMEARVAVLEQIAKTTAETLKELREDTRELRRTQERDFRLTWGGLIFLALGLAGLMAKGFNWF